MKLPGNWPRQLKWTWRPADGLPPEVPLEFVERGGRFAREQPYESKELEPGKRSSAMFIAHELPVGRFEVVAELEAEVCGKKTVLKSRRFRLWVFEGTESDEVRLSYLRTKAERPLDFDEFRRVNEEIGKLDPTDPGAWERLAFDAARRGLLEDTVRYHQRMVDAMQRYFTGRYGDVRNSPDASRQGWAEIQSRNNALRKVHEQGLGFETRIDVVAENDHVTMVVRSTKSGAVVKRLE